MKPEVKIITGATCSGKTRAALEYARERGAEIISCDSVQVYRGMDIGSAKASKAELAEIPHHLIDVAEPSEKFDVSQYVAAAKTALADILSRGREVVVAGGSGFYLKAWFAAVTDNLAIPESVKTATDAIERDGGAEALARELLKIDPHAAECVDIKNPRRVKNALERCMASGKSARELLDDFKKLPCPLGDLKRNLVILDADNDEILRRIKLRTTQMVRDGLVDETRRLIERGICNNPSASSAIGYRETIEWISNGGRDTAALCEKIVADTFALVKKQRKYFRNNLPKE